MTRTCLIVTLHINHLSYYEFKTSTGWGGQLHEKLRIISALSWREKNANRMYMYLDGLEDWKETIWKYFSFHLYLNTERPLLCLRVLRLHPLFLWKWVCSIGGMILAGGNLFEYWNASYSVRTYQIAVPASYTSPATITPTSCPCSEAYKTRT